MQSKKYPSFSGGWFDYFRRIWLRKNWADLSKITPSLGLVFLCFSLVSNVTVAQSTALHFDGNDQVDATAYAGSALPTSNSARTVEAWVKTTQGGVNIGNYVSWGTRATAQRAGFAIRNGKAGFIGEGRDVTGSAVIADGNWHHIATTYDGTTIRIYVDGVLDVSGNVALNTTGQNLVLGTISRPSVAEFYNGTLDEVRIWNYAKSLAQIVADTGRALNGNESGLVAYFDFEEGVPNANNTSITQAVNSANSSMNGTLTNFNLNGSTSNYVLGRNVQLVNAPEIIIEGNGLEISSGDISPQSADFTDFGTLQPPAAFIERTYWIKNTGNIALNLNGAPIIAIGGTSASDFKVTQSPSSNIAAGDSTSFIIRFSSSINGSKSATVSIANDDSNENPYTFDLAALRFDPIPQATALHFNGNDQIDATSYTGSSLPTGSSPRTIEAWVKTTQRSIGNFVSWGTRITSQRSSFAVRNGRAGFIGEFRDLTGNIVINDGDWHHVAATYDGTTLKIYVDGVLDVSGNISLNTIGQNLVVGTIARPSVGEFFTGTLDEVRVWNYARTQAQILADTGGNLLGTEPGLVAYFDFQEGIPKGINTNLSQAVNKANSALNGALSNFNLSGPTSNYVDGDFNPGPGNPEIQVLGNSLEIVSGDASPDASDLTDLGLITAPTSSKTTSFWIKNTGRAPLSLNGTPVVSLSGGDSAEFSISLQADTLVAGEDSTYFVLSFNPSSTGVKTTTVTIASNDADENLYTFAVRAEYQDPCANIAPGVVADATISKGGSDLRVDITTAPTGTAPFTYYFDLNGGFLGHLIDGNNNVPIQNTIEVSGVDPSDTSTYPVIRPANISSSLTIAIHTFYDVYVVDANGCSSGTSRMRIDVTDPCATVNAGSITDTVMDHGGSNVKLNIDIAPSGTAPFTYYFDLNGAFLGHLVDGNNNVPIQNTIEVTGVDPSDTATYPVLKPANITSALTGAGHTFYDVSIVDANGCSSGTFKLRIDISDPCAGIASGIIANDTLSRGGSDVPVNMTILPTGTAPFTYYFDLNGADLGYLIEGDNDVPIANTIQVTGVYPNDPSTFPVLKPSNISSSLVGAGVTYYNVSVVDANGCNGASFPMQINVTDPCVGIDPGVIADVYYQKGGPVVPIDITTPPTGTGPFTYHFGLQGAYLGNLISSVSGVVIGDTSTYPTFDPANIPASFTGSGHTFYQVSVTDSLGCNSGTYRIRVNILDPCSGIDPGLIANATLSRGGTDATVTMTTPPTGTAPFTYYFDLNGANLGYLIQGNNDVPIANTIEVTGVDPNDPNTYPILKPSNILSTVVGAGLTTYDVKVVDAHGCASASFPMQIDVTDPCLGMSSGAIADVYYQKGGPIVPINITTPPGGTGPYTYSFGLQGAYLGNLIPGSVSGVVIGDTSTYPVFDPASIPANFSGAGHTFYQVAVTDSFGCTSATYRIRVNILDHCAGVAPGLIADASLSRGGANIPVTITTPPTGAAPFTYYFDLNGAFIGNLIEGNNDVPVQHTIQVTGVDPNDPNTFPVLKPANIASSLVGAGVTFYDVSVMDANGCVSSSFQMQIDITDPCASMSPGVIADVYYQKGGPVVPIDITTPPGGTGPYTYSFGLQGAYLGNLISTTSGVVIGDTNTYPSFDPARIPANLAGAGHTFYQVAVTDSFGCTSATYRIRVNILDPCTQVAPGLIADETLSRGGLDRSISMTTPPTGTAPFTYYFDLNGANLGYLIVGNNDVPVQNTIQVTGVDPNDPNTFPVLRPANISSSLTGAGVTHYDVSVVDANGCTSATFQMQINITDPCASMSPGVIADVYYQKGGPIVPIDITTPPGGTGPYTYSFGLQGAYLGNLISTTSGVVIGDTSTYPAFDPAKIPTSLAGAGHTFYQVSVTDSLGCTSGTYRIRVDILDPCTNVAPGLIANDTLSRGASDKVITMTTPPSGTAPFTYYFDLNGANLGYLISGNNDVPVANTIQVTGVDPNNPNTFPVLKPANISSSLTGAGVTYYDVSVVDANGCTSGTFSLQINITDPCASMNPGVIADVYYQKGGPIVPIDITTPPGGTGPYSYHFGLQGAYLGNLISTTSGVVIGDTSTYPAFDPANIPVSLAGAGHTFYQVSVTDSFGCTSGTYRIRVNILDPCTNVAPGVIADATLSRGDSDVSVNITTPPSGAAPFTYYFDLNGANLGYLIAGNNDVPVANTIQVTGVDPNDPNTYPILRAANISSALTSAGNTFYDVSVVDANGCTSGTFRMRIDITDPCLNISPGVIADASMIRGASDVRVDLSTPPTGAAPFTYYFDLNGAFLGHLVDGNNNVPIQNTIEVTGVDPSDTNTYPVLRLANLNPSFNGSGHTFYDVFVVDANGCQSATHRMRVDIIDPCANVAPGVIANASMQISGSDVRLDITTAPTGTAPFTYYFDLDGTDLGYLVDGNNDVPSLNSIQVSGVDPSNINTYPSLKPANINLGVNAGDYTFYNVYVVDANGCSSSTYRLRVDIGAAPVLGLGSSTAIHFDGNDEVDATAYVGSALPTGNSARTVEAWVKTTQSGSSIGNYVSYGTRSISQRAGFAVRNGRAGFIGEHRDVTGSTFINDGKWHHVAITYDGTTIRIYVDGVLDVSGNVALNTTGQNLVLGTISRPSSGEYYNGTLDEVRIWNYAKSLAQIVADTGNALTGNESGLVAYFDFEEGTANGDNTSITAVQNKANSSMNGLPSGLALTGTSSNYVTGRTINQTNAPEISILGNNQEIISGDLSPSLTDSTDFGQLSTSLRSQTYWIKNLGSGALNLTGSPLVQILGGDSAEFNLAQSPAGIINTGDSTSFVINFNPASTGTKLTSLSIVNDDSNENPYTFGISATYTDPCVAIAPGVIADTTMTHGGQDVRLNISTPPTGTAPFTYYFDLNGAFLGHLVHGTNNVPIQNTIEVTGVDPSDVNTYPVLKPANISSALTSAGHTFYDVFVVDANGCTSGTYRLRIDISDPCTAVTPGLIADATISRGGADLAVSMTTTPTGLAPFTYYFDLNGANLGYLIAGNNDVPIANTIEVTGVDPNDPNTFPILKPGNILSSVVSAGVTSYDVTVVDANGCTSASFSMQIDVTDPCVGVLPGVIADVNYQKGGPVVPIDITTPPTGTGPYTYHFGLQGAYLGNLISAKSGVVIGDTSTYPAFDPANIPANFSGSGYTFYQVSVTDSFGCSSSTYRIRVNIQDPCSGVAPGLIAKDTISRGGADKVITMTTPPTGTAPFTYYFDLNGANLGYLIEGNNDVPVANTIEVTGVDPNNPNTFPVIKPANILSSVVGAGVTFYDVTVVDANGCTSASFPLQINVTDPCIGIAPGVIADVYYQKGGPVVPIDITTPPTGTGPFTYHFGLQGAYLGNLISATSGVVIGDTSTYPVFDPANIPANFSGSGYTFYQVSVTDSFGCNSGTHRIRVNILDPCSGVSAGLIANDTLSRGGADKVVTMTSPPSGTAPFTYYFDLNGADIGYLIDGNNDTPIANTIQVTGVDPNDPNTFPVLKPGNISPSLIGTGVTFYDVTVVDANGCTSTSFPLQINVTDPCIGITPGVIADVYYQKGGPVVPIDITTPPTGTGPFTYHFGLQGAYLGNLISSTSGVVIGDTNTYPTFDPANIPANFSGSGYTFYQVSVTDSFGCTSGTYRIRVNIVDPCAGINPGVIANDTLSRGGADKAITITTPPTGTAPFTYYFDLNGANLGYLINGNNDVPVANTIEVTGVDPSDPNTFPVLKPSNILTSVTSAGLTYYDVTVVDANGCTSASYRMQINVTDPCSGIAPGVIADVYYQKGGPVVPIDITTPPTGTGPYTYHFGLQGAYLGNLISSTSGVVIGDTSTYPSFDPALIPSTLAGSGYTFYQVSVTDSFGCNSGTYRIRVNILDPCANISAGVVANDTLSRGGQDKVVNITTLPVGTAPFTYYFDLDGAYLGQLIGGNNNVPVANTIEVIGVDPNDPNTYPVLKPGNILSSVTSASNTFYNVSVVDANGCTSASFRMQINVTDPCSGIAPGVIADVNYQKGGSPVPIDITSPPTGTGPYTYHFGLQGAYLGNLISGSVSGVVIGDTSTYPSFDPANIPNAMAGSGYTFYQVSVTDSFGCSSGTYRIRVNILDPCVGIAPGIVADASISRGDAKSNITISTPPSGTGPFSYYFDLNGAFLGHLIEGNNNVPIQNTIEVLGVVPGDTSTYPKLKPANISSALTGPGNTFYDVFVVDANGCTSGTYRMRIDITDPCLNVSPGVIADASMIPGGADVRLNITTPPSGISPFTYYFDLNGAFLGHLVDGNNNVPIQNTIEVTGVDPSDVNTYPVLRPANIASNVSGGVHTFYDVFVVDANGCQSGTYRMRVDIPVANNEIAVFGNATEITSGSLVPQFADSTRFPLTGPLVTDPSGNNDVVTRTYEIHNTGTDPLQLTGSPLVSVSNFTGSVQSSDLSITQPSSSTIAAGASTTFSISYNPDSCCGGTAMVTIPNSDADEATYTYVIGLTALSAELEVLGGGVSIPAGNNVGASNNLTIFPGTKLFNSNTRNFSLRNIGNANLIVSSISITGSDASEFEVISPIGMTFLSPNSIGTLMIKYTPDGIAGVDSAFVNIYSNDARNPVYSFLIIGSEQGTIYWDGTAWRGGSPAINEDVAILSNVPPASFACRNLDIQDGDQLQTTGITVEVYGEISNSGQGIVGEGTLKVKGYSELKGTQMKFKGILEVDPYGNLVTNDLISLEASSDSTFGMLMGNGSVNGKLNVEQYITLAEPDANGYDGRWVDMATNVTDAQFSDWGAGGTIVAANSAQGTIWFWNPNTGQYEAPASINDTIIPGRGYSVFAGTTAYATFLRPGEGQVDLKGTPQMEDVSVDLGFYDSGDPNTTGWNQLGNPFAAMYDWSQQSFAGTNNVNNAIYILRSDGTYASYVNGVGAQGGSSLLAPGQAFWVKANSANPGVFTFDADNRVTTGSTKSFKSSADYISLKVNEVGTKNTDELVVGFDQQATIGRDEHFDATKKFNNYPNINFFSVLDSVEYSINRFAADGLTDTVPLGLEHIQHGVLLKIVAKTAHLQAYDNVMLLDAKTGILTDLMIQPMYQFSNDTAWFDGRFSLIFSQNKKGLVGIEDVVAKPQPENNWFVYYTEEDVMISYDPSMQGEILQVHNAAGQLVEEHVAGTGDQAILKGSAAGVYFLNWKNIPSKGGKVVR